MKDDFQLGNFFKTFQHELSEEDIGDESGRQREEDVNEEAIIKFQ